MTQPNQHVFPLKGPICLLKIAPKKPPEYLVEESCLLEVWEYIFSYSVFNVCLSYPNYKAAAVYMHQKYFVIGVPFLHASVNLFTWDEDNFAFTFSYIILHEN